MKAPGMIFEDFFPELDLAAGPCPLRMIIPSDAAGAQVPCR